MAKRSSITMCLIRCGETTWDALGRVHGSTDLPLSDAGRSAVAGQLHRLASSRASIVHHAADEAATDTATMCAKVISGSKTRDVPELADPNLGLLEGLTEQEFAERFRSRHKQWRDDPVALVPPEGEEMPLAADRVFRAVAKVVRRSRGEEVAIVLHDLSLAMMRCWIAERPLSAMREMMHVEPGIERVIVPMSMLDAMEQAAAGLAGAAGE